MDKRSAIVIATLAFLILPSCATSAPPAGTDICTSDFILPRAEQYALSTRANIERLERFISGNVQSSRYSRSRAPDLLAHSALYALQLQNLRKLDPGMRRLKKDMGSIYEKCENADALQTEVLAHMKASKAPYEMQSYLIEMYVPDPDAE